MSVQVKTQERDQEEFRIQIEEKMKASLENQIFPTSLTYKLYQFLTTKEGKTLFGNNRVNVFKFPPARFENIFRYYKGPARKLFLRQGFQLKFETQNSQGHQKKSFYILNHNDLHSESPLQAFRDSWLKSVEIYFRNDLNFLGRFFRGLRKNITAKWLVKEKVFHYKYKIDKKYKEYDFVKLDKHILSHPYLQKKSSILVWVWVNQFCRLRQNERLKIKKTNKQKEKIKKQSGQVKRQHEDQRQKQVQKQDETKSPFLMTMEEFLEKRPIIKVEYKPEKSYQDRGSACEKEQKTKNSNIEVKKENEQEQQQQENQQ